ALAGNGFAHHALGAAITIHFGCVDEGDAVIDPGADGVDLLTEPVTALAHHPGAKAKDRHGRAIGQCRGGDRHYALVPVLLFGQLLSRLNRCWLSGRGDYGCSQSRSLYPLGRRLDRSQCAPTKGDHYPWSCRPCAERAWCGAGDP